jgi:exopolysaccharide biosynthesis polyprenyl glycosylphosphotransferase
MLTMVAEAAISVDVSKASRSRVVRSRHRDRDYALRRELLAADCLGLWIALAISLAVPGTRSSPLVESLWIIPTLPLWGFLIRTYGLYQRPIRRFEPTHLDDTSALFHVLVIGTLGLWFFYKVVPADQLYFLECLIFGCLSLGLIASLRVLVRTINLKTQGPERVFAIAPIEDLRLLGRKLSNHPEYQMALMGAVIDEGASDELGLSMTVGLDEVETVIASGRIDHLVVQLDSTYIPQGKVVELMRACNTAGIRFGAFPKDKNLLLPGVEINHVEGMGFLSYHPPVLSPASAFMKRGLDVAIAALLLALFAIPMALIACAVMIDSKGGAMYKQTRVGRDGRRFKLLKFRTMVPDADSQVATLMSMSMDPDWLILDEDPRVTRVGRILRRTSVDELPQLFNVLQGDMSLVGPRPLPERDDEAVTGWGRHRLDLVPGITGHWQVLGRNTIPFREMIEIDYAYVANWSLWHDIKLLLRTVPVVLRRRGVN